MSYDDKVFDIDSNRDLNIDTQNIKTEKGKQKWSRKHYFLQIRK